MNVLDGDLEAIERAGFRNLNLAHETNAEVFEHDAVRGGEEREHVRDKVLLILRERLPVLHVVRQIDFLRCLRTKTRAIASMYRQSHVPFAPRSLAPRDFKLAPRPAFDVTSPHALVRARTGPERRLSLLLHLPHLRELNR